MITAERLQTLTTMGTHALKMALGSSGCNFKTARFLGITNGGQFCYSVTYHNDSGEGEATGKVFVTYNQSKDQITAGF